MQTKGPPELQEEERDIELENILGNLMIAEYQVDKLRTRVSEKIARYGYADDKKVSTHMFKHDGRWIKISVKVEELAIDKNASDSRYVIG